MMENREDFHHEDLPILERAVDAVLRDPIPDELSPEQVAQLVATLRQAAEHQYPVTLLERIRAMKRIAKLVVAASILVALGIFASRMLSDGSGNLAFARVAEALDSLHSATFDMLVEAKEHGKQPPITATAKGFFLAPSRQRTEISSGTAKNMTNMLMIFDNQAGKGLMLMPGAKLAVAMDMKKMK